MEWSHPPNEVTCGDCIESLLAKAALRLKLSYAGISLGDGAHFFRELSYATWRIHRVPEWPRHTAGPQAGPHAGLCEVLHAPLHLRRCNCAYVMENPHTYTMQCQGCAKCACGLEIHLYRNRLLCRTCFAQEMAWCRSVQTNAPNEKNCWMLLWNCMRFRKMEWYICFYDILLWTHGV